MKTTLLGLVAFFALQPVHASLLSGDINAYFTFPDTSGFNILMSGNGITIDAPNVVNQGIGSEQVLCTTDCEFSGLLSGNEGASATIGNLTSASFSFDLKETGASGDFIGNLTLLVPFTSQVIATASIETFLVAGSVSNGLPSHAQTDFQFIGNGGIPGEGGGGTPGGGQSDTPEPSAWGLALTGLLALLVASSRRRSIRS